jgi:hypothetical protein
MVRPREPHQFEGEDFCAEVLHVLEHDGQIDLLGGERLDSRYDLWNGAVDGLSVDRGMPISSSVDA